MLSLYKHYIRIQLKQQLNSTGNTSTATFIYLLEHINFRPVLSSSDSFFYDLLLCFSKINKQGPGIIAQQLNCHLRHTCPTWSQFVESQVSISNPPAAGEQPLALTWRPGVSSWLLASLGPCPEHTATTWGVKQQAKKNLSLPLSVSLPLKSNKQNSQQQQRKQMYQVPLEWLCLSKALLLFSLAQYTNKHNKYMTRKERKHKVCSIVASQ